MAQIKRYLLEKGARAFKIQGGDDSFQEVGIPDLLVCYKGRFVGLEVKMPGGKLSPKQNKVLHEIADAGGIAAVVTTVGQVSHLLGKIDKEVSVASYRTGRYYRFDVPGGAHSKRQP